MAIVTMPGLGGTTIVQCSEGCVKPLPARCSAKCFRAPVLVSPRFSVPDRYSERDPLFADGDFPD